MSNEMKSEYYTSMEEAIEKYNLIPEAVPFAAGDLQGTEEMFFAFTMFLIS
ncbi:hypothetical protein J0B03_07265 [Alkalibacter rhizosphaerae]|uniref:Uncharacterized protein n=1 Tax=Alkalibacter rhizosphaerae TaxID=2815577 RepID=A0A974XD58_9FIRM|nr:hypothetical protein [Alkalibacter rhizosphaerae]QSX07634.1 hypothetical protein J0B03_07265 [Alkalibacter rhizosphaerae]